MSESEPEIVRRYRHWLLSGVGMAPDDRQSFYTDALIVLDTNVLLSLYEYTAPARDQVLSALERVKERLWLPHQVGLEFVRGRHRVIKARMDILRKSPSEINRKLDGVLQALDKVNDEVKHLLLKYARDEAAVQTLVGQIEDEGFKEIIQAWKGVLIGHVKGIQAKQDLILNEIQSDDPILLKVAELYASNVAPRPDYELIRQRVAHAHEYRYPNQIPPGFADEAKGTPAQAAGDYLIWEEIIQYIRQTAAPRKVLLISSDTKSDWYVPAQDGMPARPSPHLYEEMWQRGNADICFETPLEFFKGVNEFLDADINEATYDEIDLAGESESSEISSDESITEENALLCEPDESLRLTAYRAAGLSTAAARQAIMSSGAEHRLFQWWLIGVTAQLGRRLTDPAEPLVGVRAATLLPKPPRPHWKPGTVLRVGDWPYRSTSWIAPWFAQLVGELAEADRRVVQRLAAQQADWDVPPGAD